MIDLTLAALVVIPLAYASILVWRKIPLLLQVPQQLIEESFVTRPSKLKAVAEPVIAFVRDGRYREFYYAGLVKLLERVRLWLLRMERSTFRLLESTRKRSEDWSHRNERYWFALKRWHENDRPSESAMPTIVATSESSPVVPQPKRVVRPRKIIRKV